MTAQAITTEIQKLSPSAVIELFVMDLTLFNEGVVRFHAGTNELRRQVVWQGNIYEPFPVQAEGSAVELAPEAKFTASRYFKSVRFLVTLAPTRSW